MIVCGTDSCCLVCSASLSIATNSASALAQLVTALPAQLAHNWNNERLMRQVSKLYEAMTQETHEVVSCSRCAVTQRWLICRYA